MYVQHLETIENSISEVYRNRKRYYYIKYFVINALFIFFILLIVYPEFYGEVFRRPWPNIIPADLDSVRSLYTNLLYWIGVLLPFWLLSLLINYTYFQCLELLSKRKYTKACNQLIRQVPHLNHSEINDIGSRLDGQQLLDEEMGYALWQALRKQRHLTTQQ